MLKKKKINCIDFLKFTKILINHHYFIQIYSKVYYDVNNFFTHIFILQQAYHPI